MNDASLDDLPEVPVLAATQAADWDERARQSGMPSRVLMESAGRGVAHVITREFGPNFPRGVLVVVGHGNNGGDGWVVARALSAVGIAVCVAEYERERAPDCAANRNLALADGVETVSLDATWPRADVVVDALLGTGASGEPGGDVGRSAHRLADLQIPIVAIDGPTGLDLTTGVASGPVRAAVTVTFGGFRRGHLLAREWCGKIVVIDIGFGKPPDRGGWPLFVHDRWCAKSLPSFRADMHKGSRGSVLVVGGQEGMAGAVQYAARAAFGAGAGLVRIAAARESVAPLQRDLPDATVIGCTLVPPIEPVFGEALEWADAVVLGPGLGRGRERSGFVREILARVGVPVVIDADALHAGLEVLVEGSAPRVLTPHVGEFRSAFPDLWSGPATDRFAAVGKARQTIQSERGGHGVTVLLKGVPTIIAGCGGELVVGSGNPGLATGGSGDLLAGFIGAFLARGLDGVRASALGAQTLGRAADLAVRHTTVAAMRPSDVLGVLPALWRMWRGPLATVPPVLVELDPPVVM